MPKVVRVLSADDAHLSFLKMRFSTIARERENTDACIYEMVSEALDGFELLDAYNVLVANGEPPELITLDIEMPKADGLWTLHELSTRHNPHPPVVMVSSLDGEEVRAKYVDSIAAYDTQRGDMPDAKKRELLSKVADRIRAGQVEPGKVNTLIDAGLRLGLNPIELAEYLGAKGYVVKPYKTSEQVTSILDHAMTSPNGKFMTGRSTSL